MSLSLRIYNSTYDSYREMPAGLVQGVTANITASMGYADATVTLYGTVGSEHLTAWQQSRQVEIWFDGQRAYRGFIERIEPQLTEPATVRYRLYGRMLHLNPIPCKKRYLVQGGRETANIFGDVLSRFIQRDPATGINQPRLSVPDCQVTGIELQNLDAYDVPFESVVAAILEATSNNVIIGCDVDPTSGSDRIYLRPFSTARTTNIAVPSGSIGEQLSDDDQTDIVNIVTVVGGAARYPNLLADAVSGNTSFEVPILSGSGNGDQLQGFTTGVPDGSFEIAAARDFNPLLTDVTYVTLSGGASYKANTSDAGNARTGTYFVELDTVGETVSFKTNTGLTVGNTYTFRAWSRREKGDTAAVATQRILFYNASDVQVGSTTSISITPTSAGRWDYYDVTAVAPSGTSYARCEMVTTTASVNAGLCTDDWEFFDVNQIYQAGWQSIANGSSVRTIENWAFEESYHGGYSYFLQGVASDTNGQDINLRPFNRARFAIQPNQTLRYGFYGKLPNGSSATQPKLLLVLDFYDSNGTIIGNQTARVTVNAGTFTTSGWTCTEGVYTAPSNAVSATLYLAMRGSGTILADAFYVRDNAAYDSSLGYTPYIEYDNYERTYSVTDLTTLGYFTTSSDVYVQNVVNGAIAQPNAKRVSYSSIANDTDAAAAAALYLARYGVAQSRNSVVSFSYLPVWPGEYIRTVGSGRWPRPNTAQPVYEVSCEWSGEGGGGGLLRQTIHTSAERLTESRLIRQMVRKTTGASANGASAGGSLSVSVSAGNPSAVSTGISALPITGTNIAVPASATTDVIVGNLAATLGYGTAQYGPLSASAIYLEPGEGTGFGLQADADGNAYLRYNVAARTANSYVTNPGTPYHGNRGEIIIASPSSRSFAIRPPQIGAVPGSQFGVRVVGGSAVFPIQRNPTEGGNLGLLAGPARYLNPRHDGEMTTLRSMYDGQTARTTWTVESNSHAGLAMPVNLTAAGTALIGQHVRLTVGSNYTVRLDDAGLGIGDTITLYHAGGRGTATWAVGTSWQWLGTATSRLNLNAYAQSVTLLATVNPQGTPGYDVINWV